MLKIFMATACLLLNACMMVGPNYKEPKKKIADHWLEHDAAVKKGRSQDASWWAVFHDETLTSLIHKGYHSNLSLQSAGVRVLQARAQLAQSVGELYPQQQVMVGNYTYERLGGSSLQNILPSSFDMASLGFSANWEMDFWGKYRRAILSNDAVFLASWAAYDSALVTLISDIASTYVGIRTSEELIKVTQQNIQLQTTSLNIARARFKAGQTSLLDVQQAQTELSQTQSSLPSLMSELRRQKDLLGVLLGTVPDEVDGLLKKNRQIPKAPLSIEMGIPKEALARRPDIQQARLQAIAQSESIGAVKATLYPSLSLAGSFVFSSTNIGSSSISDLLNWSNRTITAGPGFTWPILNYGQITNAVRMQDAVFQQALLNYLNLVLQAQQEVQDNLTRYMEAKKTARYLVEANHSAMVSTQLALIRYKEGESDYTTVLDAERQQLRVQRALINAQGDIPKALVALYRSLGGGWQIRQGSDIVSKQVKQEMAARTHWGSLLLQQNYQPSTTQKQQNRQLYLPNW